MIKQVGKFTIFVEILLLDTIWVLKLKCCVCFFFSSCKSHKNLHDILWLPKKEDGAANNLTQSHIICKYPMEDIEECFFDLKMYSLSKHIFTAFKGIYIF